MRLRDEMAIRRGGQRIDGIRSNRVAAPRRVDVRIPEHVRYRVGGFPRRPERVRVVAVGEHRTAPLQDPVDRLRDADRQCLHPPRERHRVARLDDDVEMVGLHGEVHDPESVALEHRPDARCDDTKALPAPEPRCVVTDARRHVDGVPACESGPRDVRYTGAGLLRTSRAGSITASAAILVRHR